MSFMVSSSACLGNCRKLADNGLAENFGKFQPKRTSDMHVEVPLERLSPRQQCRHACPLDHCRADIISENLRAATVGKLVRLTLLEDFSCTTAGQACRRRPRNGLQPRISGPVGRAFLESTSVRSVVGKCPPNSVGNAPAGQFHVEIIGESRSRDSPRPSAGQPRTMVGQGSFRKCWPRILRKPLL